MAMYRLHYFPTARTILTRLTSHLPSIGGPAECSTWNKCLAGSRIRTRERTKSFEKTSVFRRSEEHTSELQSHLNLVCRLLLEKKKKRDAIANVRACL